MSIYKKILSLYVNVLSYYSSSSVFATWMKDLDEDPLSRKSRNRGIRKKEPKEQCNNGMREEGDDKTTK